MSITRGRLPKLIICLLLNLVLPAYAQSEGEQVSGAPVLQVGQAVLIALEHKAGLAGLQAQAEAMHPLPSQAGALPGPVLSLNATILPADTYEIPGPPTSMLAGGKSTVACVATYIINRTDTLVPEKPQREIGS
jgi:hypothetical protein